MKKSITYILTASMMLTLLAGCSANETTATSESVTEVTTEETTEATEETTEESKATPTPKPTPVLYKSPDTPELDGYELIWSDEFDGDILNEDVWNVAFARPRANNNELQAYMISDKNVFVKDGKLYLKAYSEVDSNGQVSYTSGKVFSENKADFTYGKVVVSAKVPEGRGLWPAIWMMPTQGGKYGSWPRSGEIDIMEILGHDTKTSYTTIHYGNPHLQQQGFLKLDEGSFDDGFHEYSVEWEPGSIRFYVDGVNTLSCNDWYSSDGAKEKDYPAPFDKNFYLILNLAVGGDWPGDPDETTNFDKAEFVVDYVRVYQLPEYNNDVKRPEKSLRDPDSTGNYVNNGDFSSDEDFTDSNNWQFLLNEGGAGSIEVNDKTAVIKTDNEGDVDYSLQLVSMDIPMENGKKYRVSFDAKADEERSIIAAISGPNHDYIRYGGDQTFTLGKDLQTFQYEFEMTEDTDPAARLEFNMGHSGSVATIYISNVRIEEIN